MHIMIVIHHPLLKSSLWFIGDTFVTGSRVAACENATSVNGAGNGLEATSAVNVRLWTSTKACMESCHRSSTNLHLHVHIKVTLKSSTWIILSYSDKKITGS